MNCGFQIVQNSAQRVFHRRQLRPGLRRPPHVIQNEPGIAMRSNLRHVGIKCQIRRIVDDFRAVLDRLRRYCRFVSIH